MSNLKWFWLFLKTRSNWIFWIVFLHLILLGMAYIDYDISIEYRIYSNVKSRSYSDVLILLFKRSKAISTFI